MKIFEAICAAIVTAAAAFLMIEGGLFLRDARSDLAPVAFHAQSALMQAENDLRGAALVEMKILESTQKFSDAADEQAAYWQKTQLQVYKLITDTKEIMVRTDRSLNNVSGAANIRQPGCFRRARNVRGAQSHGHHREN